MAKRTELVCVLADIHAGSVVAVLPKDFQTEELNPVERNPIQEWLGECWDEAFDFVKTVRGGSRMDLVLNGDLIEGDHHRTTQIISRSLGDHIKAAKELLTPWANLANEVHVVKGTECHTQNCEADIARYLRATPDRDGRYAQDRLTRTYAGCPGVWVHHTTTASRMWTEATGLGMQLANEQVEATRNGEVTPAFICTAHRHRYGMYEDGNGLSIVSPPWQMLTRHGHKVVPSARTKPGVYLLDWRNLPEGSLPRVHRKLFRHVELP